MRIRINFTVFKQFAQSGSVGGILLLVCVVISLILANSSWGAIFENILSKEIGFTTSNIALSYSVRSWINDGLMAIFFLLVGLEIKR